MAYSCRPAEAALYGGVHRLLEGSPSLNGPWSAALQNPAGAFKAKSRPACKSGPAMSDEIVSAWISGLAAKRGYESRKIRFVDLYERRVLCTHVAPLAMSAGEAMRESPR